MKKGLLALATMALSGHLAAEPTRADQSEFARDEFKANTSRNLSKADLAWHALNSYGWNCPEVIQQTGVNKQGYSVITCKNGTKLRVYLRSDAHPRITNINGGYE
ncbi:hypothetical protein [Pseudomonas sp. Marseille-QA0892]